MRWLLLPMVSAAACASAPHRTLPLSRLDAEYARGTLATGAPPVAATQLYRGVLARSLGTRCRMFPGDSEVYDRRAARCGATAAAVLGIARLYLEVAAGADLAPVLVAEGRVRWVDLPDDCRP
jgi:putative component of membrane protein insertase Oxa1/YidC/SpoIIIJ protein YidD